MPVCPEPLARLHGPVSARTFSPFIFLENHVEAIAQLVAEPLLTMLDLHICYLRQRRLEIEEVSFVEVELAIQLRLGSRLRVESLKLLKRLSKLLLALRIHDVAEKNRTARRKQFERFFEDGFKVVWAGKKLRRAGHHDEVKRSRLKHRVDLIGEACHQFNVIAVHPAEVFLLCRLGRIESDV